MSYHICQWLLFLLLSKCQRFNTTGPSLCPVSMYCSKKTLLLQRWESCPACHRPCRLLLAVLSGDAMSVTSVSENTRCPKCWYGMWDYISRAMEVNSLTVVHRVPTIFMNEREVRGRGKFVPVLVFINERRLAVGTEPWASAPIFASPLLVHGLDRSQQHGGSSEWDWSKWQGLSSLTKALGTPLPGHKILIRGEGPTDSCFAQCRCLRYQRVLWCPHVRKQEFLPLLSTWPFTVNTVQVIMTILFSLVLYK